MTAINDMRIIRLTDHRPVKPGSPRAQRIRGADLVIDRDGKVIKDRHGRSTGRHATHEEIQAAVRG